MKSIKMFGKSVPLLTIMMVSVLFIGASAYLVNYLSTTVATNVAVMSPMEVGLSLGTEAWATAQRWRPGYYHYPNEVKTWVPGAMLDAFPEGLMSDGVTYVGLGDGGGWLESDWTKTGILVIPEIMGGETITLYFMSANLADAHIHAHEEIRVSNPGGITVDDFVNVTTRFDPIYSDNGYSREYIDNLGEEDVWQVNSTCIEMWSDDDTSDWGAGETDVARWQITFKDNAAGTYTFTYRITPAP